MKSLIVSTLTALALTVPAVAQTTFNADSATAALQLTEVSKRGDDLTGRLPSGQVVELEFRRDGSLEEIEARNPRLVPVAAVTALLPQQLLSAERFPADGQFENISFDRDGYEFEGRDAQDRKVEIKYNSSFALVEYELD
ncbi:MAG: hypothetical protein Q4G24_04290 [Paracoccus sp. (in: a-proteobacteria)]|uniref:hypothetical protein n=1 Tax=Paracoccus sp. TaxID=267 RepID=UPI0026DF3F63|nr:hypothetical protein [Paracoccus sp. (in: a-proteobacteria)]MDO5620670.1 hypothetical protein [Paracoccus sp. (in: a-proteobacteria)]